MFRFDGGSGYTQSQIDEIALFKNQYWAQYDKNQFYNVAQLQGALIERKGHVLLDYKNGLILHGGITTNTDILFILSELYVTHIIAVVQPSVCEPRHLQYGIADLLDLILRSQLRIHPMRRLGLFVPQVSYPACPMHLMRGPRLMRTNMNKIDNKIVISQFYYPFYA